LLVERAGRRHLRCARIEALVMAVYVSCLELGARSSRKPTVSLSGIPTPVQMFPYNGCSGLLHDPWRRFIPGTTGKVLGVLARTHAELPIRRVAQLGGVSRDPRQHRDPPARFSRHRLPSGGGRRFLVKLERNETPRPWHCSPLADARSTAISQVSVNSPSQSSPRAGPGPCPGSGPFARRY